MSILHSIKEKLKIAGAYFRYNFLAFAAFILVLNITILVYLEFKRRNDDQVDQIFALKTRMVESTIEDRFDDYVRILKGARGLYDASRDVSRQDWNTYITALGYEDFPGIQGIGFAEYVRDTLALKEVIQRVRAEGYPDFTVLPAGVRDFYTPIIYLEPFEARNLRAFGYDMFSHPVRRKAMEAARDQGKPVVSGKVTLVQETGQDIQSGFLLYFPVYNLRDGKGPVTVQGRREQLTGFVYNPFRANDLFNFILKDNFTYMNIEIFDGDTATAETLLYDNNEKLDFSREKARRHRMSSMRIGGHTWTIHYSTLPGFSSAYQEQSPSLILAGGSILATLFFTIILIWLRTQKYTLLTQTITDNATAAMFMINPKGYCTFMNPAAEEMTGFSFEEIGKQPLHLMIHHSHPDGTPYAMKDCPLHQRFFERSSLREHEDVFIRKNGEHFHVSCAASLVYENNRPVAMIIEARDITEAKMNQLALAESQARFHKMADNAPVMIWVTDTENRCTYVNKQWLEFTGQKFEEALGHGWENALHPDDINEKFMELESLKNDSIPFKIDFRIRRYDGIYRWTVSTGVARTDENGQNMGYIGSIIDITDRKEAEEKLTVINKELKVTNEKLVRINNDLDNFIYTASHDLKAPISNIEGLMTALTRHVDQEDEKNQKIIRLIGESINRFKGTVQDLTDITKIQKNLAEDVGEVNIAALVKEELENISLIMDTSKANFHLRVDPGIAIKFSRVYFKSILYNLISNALKYQSPNRFPEIAITTDVLPDNILLQVKDNGMGIKEEHLGKIFGMFKRAHTHVEGTGIGLYMIKRMIENYGGSISLESKIGVGSTFSVYLPRNNGR